MTLSIRAHGSQWIFLNFHDVAEKTSLLKKNPLFLESIAQVTKRALASQSFLPWLFGYVYDEASACKELELSVIRLAVHVYDTAYENNVSSFTEFNVYLVAVKVMFLKAVKDKCPIHRKEAVIRTLYEMILKKCMRCAEGVWEVEDLSEPSILCEVDKFFYGFDRAVPRAVVMDIFLRSLVKAPRLLERITSYVSDCRTSRQEKVASLEKHLRERVKDLSCQKEVLLRKAYSISAANLIANTEKKDLQSKLSNHSAGFYLALRFLVHVRMDLGLSFLGFFQNAAQYDDFFSLENIAGEIVKSELFSRFVDWLNSHSAIGVMLVHFPGIGRRRIRDATQIFLLLRSSLARADASAMQLEREIIEIAGKQSTSGVLEISPESLIGRLNAALAEFSSGPISDELFASAAEGRMTYLEGLIPRLLSMAAIS